jgi:hypothetical protein
LRLTDLSIKALALPAKGVMIYSDDTFRGFGVRVSQAGTKSFVLTHGDVNEQPPAMDFMPRYWAPKEKSCSIF